MKRTLLTLIVLFIGIGAANAQITVTIPDAVAAVGQEVTVPIQLGNVEAGAVVQAFTLRLTMSDPNIVFVGSDFSGGLTSGGGWSTRCIVASNYCDGFSSSNDAFSTSGTLVNLTFRLDGSMTGETITFSTFTLNGGLAISPSTPTITVSTSAAPISVADAYTVNEGETLTVAVGQGVLANDVDIDPLTATLGTSTSNGVLTFSADGSFSYVHDGSETTTDSFTYTASDGTDTGSVTTATITITPVNDAPVVSAATLTTLEDTAGSVTLSGTDADGDALTYSAGAATNGTVTVSGSTATYTPNAGYNGADSFTYTANDGTVDSAPATVTVTVTLVNDTPVAVAASLTTAEDTAGTVTLSGTDGDGDALTFTAGAASNGTVTVSGSTATYTPNANYNGVDLFTYTANDGTVDSAPATVTVTVTAVNDVPVASAATLTTLEDTAGSVTLSGTDADGDALTYSAGAATNGTVTVSGSTATYTPNAGYYGADSFTYTANDGTVDSAPATVTVTVTVVNETPVAVAASLTTTEDTAGTVTLSGTDSDGDALTFTAGAASNGTVTVSGSTATYTPNANYNGVDLFTYTANDGTVDSAPATVTVTVTAVNDAPVSSAGTLTTNEDTAGTVTLAATDVDGDALTYTASNGTSGTVTVAGAVATYTPNANFNGTDSFTFTANDGTVDSNSSTVTVTVSAVNDAPVAAAATLTTDEDTAGTVTLSATDADGDALTYTATQPANGSVTVAGAVATYTPNANYNGADSFTFTANDGTVDSASATVSVTVTAVNDAPVAVAQSIAVAEDTPGAATLAGSDVDGDALTFSIASQPSNGTVSLVGTTATYTPGANYSGADSFTFVANDGTVDSDPATVTVTVSGVNDAPVATDLTGSGAEDTMISVVLIATDSEGDPVTYALVSDASNGSVVVTGAQAVYTPEANYNGTDSFTYSASDQNATSAPATVTLTVTSVNDAPSVENVSVSTTNDAAAAVQFLGSDVDGDALTFSIAAAPAFGTVTVSGSSASYQANAGFVGTDSFGYVANDGTDDSAMGVVSITVLPALTFSVQFINSGGSGIPSAVDVYYGGSLVATGLSARAGTAYLTLPAGGVTVAVAESPSVSAASAFASYTPGWSQGDQVVAVLSGVGGSPASTRLISFSGSSASSDPALIDARFVHASGASGVLDIGTISTTSDHLPLVGYASGVTFESVTSVQTLPSESAVFRVKNSGISGATLGEYQIDLSSDAGDSMTMILAGQSGGTGLDDLVLFGISADGTPRIPVTVTDIDYESEQPKEFVLDGNFPNPFNPSTNIQFDLPSQAEVKVDVLDLLGRNMISIPAQTFGAGPDQSISIDASSLPSGIYIYRVVAHTSAKTFVSTRTMTLIK